MDDVILKTCDPHGCTPADPSQQTPRLQRTPTTGQNHHRTAASSATSLHAWDGRACAISSRADSTGFCARHSA